MLIWEEKVTSNRDAFISEVKRYSGLLGINPNWLMAVMNFESGLKPQAVNPYSGATGLIQFMPATARELGTTVDQLYNMSNVEQLEYVYKYYVRYKSKLKSYVDLYLITFFPIAVGKPLDWVLQTSNISASLLADQNPVFDLNNDNTVTVGEITEVMLSKIPDEWQSEFRKTAAIGTAVVLLALVGIGIYITKKS